MVLNRLLQWLFWIALVVLFLYAVGRFSSSRRATRPAPAPEEQRLFNHWWTGRGTGWVPDIPIYDWYGNYFYKDLNANIAALAILRTKKILPHTDPNGLADAGPDRATLFSGTRFAVEVRATKDTFVVIRPDLSIVSLELRPDDVKDMLASLRETMESPSGPFSLIAEIYRWAGERDRTELEAFLEEYREEVEAEEFVP